MLCCSSSTPRQGHLQVAKDVLCHARDWQCFFAIINREGLLHVISSGSHANEGGRHQQGWTALNPAAQSSAKESSNCHLEE